MERFWIAILVLMVPAVAFAQSDTANKTSAPAQSESASPQSTDPVTITGPLPQRVLITQGVSQGLLIHQVAPVYPETARMNLVEGTVVLRAVIGKDGVVRDLHVESSPSDDLSQAALTAVQQWTYRPYLLSGEPVEIDTTINVNFKLKK